MAMNQQELVDTLAGLALFADLTRPQLEAVAHKMTEESYPTGQRILRQGFTGTGFYVIVEGEVAVSIDGNEIARLGKGDFFGEMSILLGEPPDADIVTTASCASCTWAAPSSRASCSTTRASCAHDQDDRHAAAQRKPMAELDATGRSRRATIRSSSSAAGRAGSRPAITCAIWASSMRSSPPTLCPGGMFRRFPFFQRLLSWTKPYAPVPRDDPLLLLVRLELAARRGARATAR